MARKPWEQLSEPYRKRLTRAGITPAEYTSGASLKAARGHGATPERPERAFRHPDLYGQYLRRRVAQGKHVPQGMISEPIADKFPGGRRFIGDEIGYAGRDSTYSAVITRSKGGGANGESGTITIIRANPRTGEWDTVQTYTYNQQDFVRESRDLKAKGYVIQVVSVPAMGITA